MSDDICSKPRCRRSAEIVVDGVPLCDKHWDEHIQKLEERRIRELRGALKEGKRETHIRRV